MSSARRDAFDPVRRDVCWASDGLALRDANDDIAADLRACKELVRLDLNEDLTLGVEDRLLGAIEKKSSPSSSPGSGVTSG